MAQPTNYRWRLRDNVTQEDLYFQLNPNTMTSPFPEKKIAVTPTLFNKALVYQGTTEPVRWTFGGEILTKSHYERLRAWVYERPYRMTLRDHFGRNMVVILTRFNPTPKRTVGKYWRHTYEIEALVFSVSNSQVYEDGISFASYTDPGFTVA